MFLSRHTVREIARTDQPVMDIPSPLLPPLPSVADYDVLEVLGRGGMGIVYKARQVSLHRLVALKMIRDGLLATEEQLARFQGEARAVARLRHPNVVQIYAIGQQDGRPFFSLELVEGGNLAQRLTKGPLPPQESAHLVQTLARAVQHAHEQCIVHRDLKPANVLLTVDGQPKITDFGLAKELEAEVFLTHTSSGALMGTPSYMAPEQAWGKTREIGPRADVYALGAILYETLTGRPPFLATTLMDVLDQVRTQDPAPPRHVQSQCPRDLETICLKCLNKDPARRYATAGELADDLQRYLDGESIQARPAGKWERGVKWVRRRPTTAALSAVTLVACLLVGTVIWVAENRLGAGASGGSGTELKTDKPAYASLLSQADQALEMGDRDKARRVLEDCPSALRGWEWDYLKGRCEGVTRTVREAHVGGVFALASDPQSARVASGGEDGKIRFWDPESGQEVRQLPTPPGRVMSLAFSPDGQLMVAAINRLIVESPEPIAVPKKESKPSPLPEDSDKGLKKKEEGRRERLEPYLLALAGPDRLLEQEQTGPGRTYLVLRDDAEARQKQQVQKADVRKVQVEGRVVVWDLRTGRERITLPPFDSDVTCVAFSPDGKRLATATGLFARMPQTLPQAERMPPSPRRLEKEVPDKSPKRDKRGEPGADSDSDKGKAGGDRGDRQWHTALAFADSAEPPLLVQQPLGASEERPAGEPGSATILIPMDKGEVALWDLETGKKVLSWKTETAILCLAFHPGGQSLVAGCGDGHVRMWDRQGSQGDGKEGEEWKESLLGNPSGIVYSVTFPTADCLAIGGSNGAVRLWDLQAQNERFRLLQHTDAVTDLAFLEKGKRLATASKDRTVRVWSVETGEHLLTLRGHPTIITAAVASGQGKYLVSGDGDGRLMLWGATAPKEEPKKMPLPDKRAPSDEVLPKKMPKEEPAAPPDDD
jgi:WD40 repeat protein/tRNA A-37 threonylcarbamoyl transferase component Bud32